MSKNILIVDDEEDVQAITKLGLEMVTGWQVTTVNSGQEALNLAVNYQPDIILLDLMMPDMDGRTTLQKLKNNPLTQSIPIILLTAKVQQSDQDAFDDLDVIAVFAKPFRPLQLATQINQAMGWHEK
jgi:CheY-like chemotaxis protein